MNAARGGTRRRYGRRRWRCGSDVARTGRCSTSSRRPGATCSARRCCCATCSTTTPTTRRWPGDLFLCEQEGDRIAHDIIHLLHARRGGCRSTPPTATSSRPRSTTSSTSPSRPRTPSGSTTSRRRWSRPTARRRPRRLRRAGRARAARAAHGRRAGRLPRRDPPPGERGRPDLARRRRVALPQRDRPDRRDPLEGHLRGLRGQRRRLRDGRARARGHLDQAAGPVTGPRAAFHGCGRP